MKTSELIRIAQAILAEHGDIPVTVDDCMSEGALCNVADKFEVLEVGNHPLRAYNRTILREKGSVKVFNIRSSEA